MHLRQIALVAEDLEPVKQQFFTLLGLDDAFVDPQVAQFGLHNIVMPIGRTFLEVVSPIREGTTAGRLLQRRGGDGGYMVIVQADDIARERQRVLDRGITIAWEVDTGRAAALHLHPRDVPGAIASIDQMKPPEAWYWAGPDWASRAASGATAITAVEIQSSHPIAVSQRWANAFDRPVRQVAGVPTLQLDSGSVRFVQDRDGRGDGLRAIDLQVPALTQLLQTADSLSLPTNGNTVTVCGTVLNCVEA